MPRRPHAALGTLGFQGPPPHVKRAGRKDGGNRSFLCPACGGGTAVIDSRPRGSGVRRRRVCLDSACGCRITTGETVITAKGDYESRLNDMILMVSSLKAQIELLENTLLIAASSASYAGEEDEVQDGSNPD